MGRHKEALTAVEEAVAIRRQLAEARPDAFLPGLAVSLSNQSNRLGHLGRHEEALAAVEQSVATAASSPRPAPTRSSPASPCR